MATNPQYFLNVGLAMSNDNPVSKQPRVSVFRCRISTASAQAYIAAADDAARAATPAGVLMAAVDALSEGTKLSYGISYEIEDGSVAPPASDAGVYPFDKFAVSYKAGFDNYQVTIPGRNLGGVFVESDGISIVIDPADAQVQTTNFINAFEAIALGKNAVTADVTRMYVVS